MGGGLIVSAHVVSGACVYDFTASYFTNTEKKCETRITCGTCTRFALCARMWVRYRITRGAICDRRQDLSRFSLWLFSLFVSFSRGLFTLGFLPPLCFDRPCLDSSGSARDHGGELLDASGGGGSVRRGRGRSLAAGKAMLPSISGGILRHGTDGNSRERATTNERGVAQVQHSRGLVALAAWRKLPVGVCRYSTAPSGLIVDPCSAKNSFRQTEKWI